MARNNKRTKRTQASKGFHIDKSTLSLCVALLALLVSILAYFGPQQAAMQRLAPQLDAARYFRVAIFATCDDEEVDEEVCETALELAIVGAEEAMKALEAERSDLSGSDFNNAYQAIYGTYMEAKNRQFSRENPGMSLPKYDFDQDDIQRIRELSENPN